MTDLNPCPSCREPMDHPSGDGCANMTAHKGRAMSDEQLIARLDHWIEQQVLVLVDSDLLPIRDRIEALTEQRDAARQDAKEAEAYAEELERELNTCRMAQAVMDNTAADLEDKLAKAVATERARIVKLLDGIDRTELDDNGWWETSFGAKFGEGILNAILKGESHE